MKIDFRDLPYQTSSLSGPIMEFDAGVTADEMAAIMKSFPLFPQPKGSVPFKYVALKADLEMDRESKGNNPELIATTSIHGHRELAKRLFTLASGPHDLCLRNIIYNLDPQEIPAGYLVRGIDEFPDLVTSLLGASDEVMHRFSGRVTEARPDAQARATVEFEGYSIIVDMDGEVLSEKPRDRGAWTWPREWQISPVPYRDCG